MQSGYLPVILLLGAKSAHSPLPSIPAELSALKALLDQHKQADPAFLPEYEPYFTQELLKTKLDQLAGQVAVLHFAGHSDGKALVTDKAVVYARHIADILKSWSTRPALIFLNGCHNAEQVKLFHAAGVPLVIATHRAIDDGQAAGFAQAFYASLFAGNGQVTVQEAFTRAGSKVLLTENRQVRSLDIGEIDKADTDDWDWGLFARHPEYAETWTIRHLLTEGRPILDADGKPINPYRGLEAFREEDRRFFFGREALTAKLLEIIPKQRFFSLLGASGSGKSSLVSAGLIPHLREQKCQWLILPMRPGNDPFRELAGVLLESFYVDELQKLNDASPLARLKRQKELAKEKAELAAELRNEAEQALHEKKQSLEEDGAWFMMAQEALKHAKAIRLLLFIDQFEEMFTQSSPDDAQAFQLQLSALVNTEKLPCSVLVAMRADFLAAALGYPQLARLLNQFPDEKLPPMDKADVRAAIVSPAKKQRVTVEPDLVEALLDDMQGQADGLPLLQLVLTKLWETGAADDSLITRQEYNNLGGLAKTLQTHAEEVFAKLADTEQAQCEQLFLKLIRYGEEASTRRRAYVSDLKQSAPEAEVILAKLAASHARLITMKQTGQDEAAYAEIAHEALIRHWDRLGGAGGWIEKHKKDLLIENELSPLAGKWVATNSGDPAKRDASYLLTGSRLGEAEVWLANNVDSTLSQVAVFIQASVDERNRQEELERQKAKELRRRQLEANYHLAKVFEEKVTQLIPDKVIRGEELAEPLQIRAAWLYGLDAAVQAVPEGKQAVLPATLGRLSAVSEQDLSTERKQTPSLNIGHSASVNALAYSPDGKVIASGSGDQTVRLWDAATGKELNTLSAPVSALAYSPDGKVIASGSWDQTVRLWDAATGQELKTLSGHTAEVSALAYSPDGKVIASGSWDQTVRLWDAATGKELNTLSGHSAPVNALAYSPDGKVIASGSWDQTVRLWEPNSLVFRLIYDFDSTAVSAVLRFVWEMRRDELQIKAQPHPPALFPELGYHITWTDETRKLRPLLDMPNPDETKLGQVVRFLEAQCAYKDPKQKADCEAKKP